MNQEICEHAKDCQTCWTAHLYAETFTKLIEEHKGQLRKFIDAIDFYSSILPMDVNSRFKEVK